MQSQLKAVPQALQGFFTLQAGYLLGSPGEPHSPPPFPYPGSLFWVGQAWIGSVFHHPYRSPLPPTVPGESRRGDTLDPPLLPRFDFYRGTPRGLLRTAWLIFKRSPARKAVPPPVNEQIIDDSTIDEQTEAYRESSKVPPPLDSQFDHSLIARAALPHPPLSLCSIWALRVGASAVGSIRACRQTRQRAGGRQTDRHTTNRPSLV